MMADSPKKPYGDVTYADPGYQADKKKRYPIDTAEHCKAAWSYINQAGNASKYSPEQLAAIKAKIKAAAKKFGIDISESKSADGGEFRMERRTGMVWELDAPADGDPRFRGKAIAYNSRTSIGDVSKYGFFEEIAPGAVERSLAEDDQVLLVNHDTSLIVARRSAGTLQLRSGDDGLYVEAHLPDDLSYARDLRANLQHRNITGMSFGFNVRADEWSGVEGGELRRITDLQLMEVSAVTFPAYTATEASFRFSPMLAERRDKWVEPSAESEVVPTDLDRRMRWLALRYDLPMTAKGE